MRSTAPLTALGLAITLVVMVLDVGPCSAQSSEAELRAYASSVSADVGAKRAAGDLDANAQQMAIQRLGKLVLRYVELSDLALQTGTEQQRKGPLLGAYEAIREPLDRIYEENNARLESMAQSVMEVDGDLEALYETPDWKEGQLTASQALYYRNWLHYYGARLYEGATRKQLLERAERGFSEFAIGERRTELITESLLGRALCHLELGNYDWASRDFHIVSEDNGTSPERRAKARLGLLDTAARAGKTQETLRLSESMLREGTPQESLIRYYRLRALLAASKSSSGNDADDYRRQALTEADRLRRSGEGWRLKVEALIEAEVEHPERWAGEAASPAARWSVAKLLAQKGDYKSARPLLEAIVSGTDADSKSVAAEAHYLLGLACFQAGEYARAADHFTRALDKPAAEYAADASYMRFKSLEAIIAANPEAGERDYEAAMRHYLEQYPTHRSAFEARYRLGEWLQAHKRFGDAVLEYEQVSGDQGFELRARFGALQCRFEILQGNDGRRVGGTERDELIAAVGKDIERFNKLAGKYDQRGDKSSLPFAELRAKAAIMNAVYATVSPEPHDEQALAGLADFEKSYPDETALFPQTVRLRLGALRRLGRFTEAGEEIRAHGRVLASDGNRQATEALAIDFQKEGVHRKTKGEEAAGGAAQKVAAQLYELLLADSNGDTKMRLALATLYEGSKNFAEAAQAYQEVLKADAGSLVALQGLARTSEAQRDIAGALGYWQRVAKQLRPGDYPWYAALYETARLTLAVGEGDASCLQLTELKPAMPGLSDADLRAKFSELYQQACK